MAEPKKELSQAEVRQVYLRLGLADALRAQNAAAHAAGASRIETSRIKKK